MYKILFTAIIIIGLITLFARSRRKRQRYQDAVDSYVNAIFSKQAYRPEVIAGFTYGIPSFTLKFDTDKEKQNAISNQLTNQFLSDVQALCGHLRPRGQVFNAERAVAIYSKEDEKRWAQEAAAYHNERNQ
jgi:hypothetical protein